VIGRRRLPPELEERFAAFGRTLRAIGDAKDALTSVVPTTRLPGRPLAEAIDAFEAALDGVDRDLTAWRAPELEDAWQEARAGVERSRGAAEALRGDASDPTGFEGLIGAVADVLDPLDAVQAAAERFRELRERRPRLRRPR